jgi:hypothetical protein
MFSDIVSEELAKTLSPAQVGALQAVWSKFTMLRGERNVAQQRAQEWIATCDKATDLMAEYSAILIRMLTVFTTENKK